MPDPIVTVVETPTDPTTPAPAKAPFPTKRVVQLVAAATAAAIVGGVIVKKCSSKDDEEDGWVVETYPGTSDETPASPAE